MNGNGLISDFISRWMKDAFNNKKSLFCFLVVLTLLISLAMIIVRSGDNYRWVLFYDQNDTFMDFFNSIWDSQFENPYVERGVIYPPLTYMIYRFFGHLIPTTAYSSTSFALRNHQAGMISLSIYFIFSIVLLAWSMYVFIKKWDRKPWSVILAVLISSPMLYTFERGNLIILSVAALLVYLAWYDCEDKRLREVALIALAVSANIKIFPAVFGLLLLQRKRWGEALRCVIYALLLLLLPMFFFGGLSNIPVLIKNILSTSDGFEAITRSRVDIGNVFRMLSSNDVFPNLFSLLASLTLPLGAIVLCVISCLVSDVWKKILALTLICVALPGFSWIYNLIYFIPVLLYCIYDSDYSGKSIIYYFLLIMMFLYYPFNVMKLLPISVDNSNYTYRLWDIISTGCNFLLILMVCLDGLYEGLVIGNRQIKFSGIGSRQLKRSKKICFSTGKSDGEDRESL